MKVFSSLVILLCSVIFLSGQGDQAFNAGNSSYENKRYGDAIIAYNSVINDGKVSPELYHNLGNAYYQNKQIGNAMLAYERGLKLDPANAEIIRDRDFLKDVIESDIFEVPAFLPVRIWNAFCRFLPANIWVLLQLLGLIGIVGYLFVFWLRPTSMHPSWLSTLKTVSTIVVLISTLVLLSIWYQDRSDNSAIIMEETTLYTGADERSEEVGPIKAGEKVKVLELFNDWARVQLLNLEEGFVLNDHLEKI